ncbi:MAG: hypothetical protein AAFO04_02505 [Cyanobacteria bacterium J06592_8]
MFNLIASIPISTFAVSVASLICFITLFILDNSAQASILKGGFESGEFSDEWISIGEASIVQETYGVTPVEGEFQALITTKSSSVPDRCSMLYLICLESFLELPAGSLDTLIPEGVVEGSAIKRSFSVQAGDTLSFSWNFLSNETIFDQDSTTFNDVAFVSIGTVENFADTSNLHGSSNTIFDTESGYQTFSHTFTEGGTYLLGIGVLDAKDDNDFFASGVLIDNIEIHPVEIQSVPEATIILGWFVVLGTGVFLKNNHANEDKNSE